MNWKKGMTVLATMLVVLGLVGCGGSGSKSNGGSPAKTVEISMDLSMAALYTGKSAKSTASKATAAADTIMLGELLAVNHDTGKSETIAWSAYLDEADLNITSNKTIALEPGDYSFSLVLANDTFRYVGETDYEVVDGGQHSIPLTIKPVIGDTNVNVSVIGELAGYKFHYATSELTDIAEPQLGVIVDGGAEQMFMINKSTGISDLYLNLTNGSHTIHLNLYDANIQIGRSVPEQETITVVAGEPFNIDLIALHGEAEFIIDVTGGTATVRTNIPQEVIDEVGLSNLQVILMLSDNNATVKEAAMTLTTENNVTTGSVTLDDVYYGTYTMQLKFNNISDTDVPVASCLIDSVILDKSERTVDCTLTLQRRSIIGGNLLATVGVNVFNTDYEPIAGAKVYANDNLIGLTNSGSFGTKGYLKMYHLAGDVTFKAEDINMTGSKDVTLEPLSVVNHDIILDKPLYSCNSTATHDIFGDGSAVATYLFDGDASDLGGSYDGIGEGNVTYSDGKFAQAAIFDGRSQIGTPDLLAGLPTYSISMWINTDDTTETHRTFFDSGTTTATGSGEKHTSMSLNVDHTFNANVDGGFNHPATTTLLNDGTWHHVVLMKNSATNWSVYIDDQLEDNWEANAQTYQIVKSTFGSSNFDDQYFTGKIDQARIFNRVLTPAEVTKLYNERTNCQGYGKPWKYAPDALGDALNWESMGAFLPEALGRSQVAVIGENVYLFGGLIPNSYTNSIYSAPLNNITSWDFTGTISTKLSHSQNALVGEKVYMFGGYISDNTTPAIYEAPISDPTIMANTGEKIPDRLMMSQVAVIGDSIYLFGGQNRQTMTKVIYKAPIENPTDWHDTGVELPMALSQSQLAVIDQFIYLFGGIDSKGNYSNVILRASVTNPTDWNVVGELPIPLGQSQVSVIGQYVYLFGGANANGYLDKILRAQISSPTDWDIMTENRLPSKLGLSQVAIIDDYVYLFGGNTGSGPTKTIFRAYIGN